MLNPAIVIVIGPHTMKISEADGTVTLDLFITAPGSDERATCYFGPKKGQEIIEAIAKGCGSAIP